MIAAIIIGAVLLMFIINGIYSLWEEHKKGILCECVGDCKSCKIKCRSNVNYYGTKQSGVPAVERARIEASLLPENLPLIIRFIRRSRDITDKICWWIFNIFGAVYVLALTVMIAGKFVIKIMSLF